MSDQSIVVIIGSIVAVIAIVYFVATYMKGYLQISVQRASVAPGELMRGRVKLVTRGAVDSNNLRVALVCREILHYQRKNGSHETRREVYRDETILEGTKNYSKGFQKDYDFEFTIPPLEQFGETSHSSFHVSIGPVGFSSAPSRRLDWRVDCRLDAKGIDLTASRSVVINDVLT